MDVAAWLSGLGLEQYAELFRENDIEGEILYGMTAEDLKELGISSFGHRRRLLNAIAALGREPPTRDLAQSAASAASAPASPPTIDAERRQLTVMFCDLVGSTPLAARYDPEDLREIVGAYHCCVADTAARFAGFVAKYMGDGVLIYFGYPEAHEDDAERAVRAGLAVIDAVARLPAPEPLNVRLGIASGLVVVGDLIGRSIYSRRLSLRCTQCNGRTPSFSNLSSLKRHFSRQRRKIGLIAEIFTIADRAVSAEQSHAQLWPNNATRLSGKEWLSSATRA